MKNYAEIQDALRAGKKLTTNGVDYIHIANGNLVWGSGSSALVLFDHPEHWHILKKQWQPKSTESPYVMIASGDVDKGGSTSQRLAGSVRKDKKTAERDNREWVAARRLEAFVREHAPDFVPIRGDVHPFIEQSSEGIWRAYCSTYSTVGTVPFPNNPITTKAVDMLNDGTLKLYDYEGK